ncbi:putative aromatic acid exporter [Heterobasidion irregulare TC 32-1]|uniref:Putative aromatic acid exporter n=1 Tax=Heterobasidion irregulare (strain TC 32-1) TaxID=747525 RepID=W4K7R2_HETIT|nr:putative aromatic acid exporter [Heterobasidion irregulare TC 32-1]ETW81116.1 putative aromatic acid exporter [Heterobasidion irregulare TC 32-1]
MPALPTLYRNILKCSVAYFIGSLFTYSPYLSGLISAITTRESSERFPAPSGHMVATVAVYFNPAKTIGGMMEADRYCLMGLAFAAFVSLGSMNMYWWFEVRHGWEWLADVLVILWIGLGMSFVAWMKLWMAKPTFNTACSMTAIILFVVVVKEGGVAQLLQVSFIVFVGSIISNLICCCLWPQSATRNLQNNMIHTLNSYSMLLKLLTRTFLLDAPLHHPREAKIQKAVADHQASFTSLKRNLAEAKSEGIFGPGNGAMGKGKDAGAAYEDAVDSLNRLAQHLNGLRSGTSLQYDLAKAHLDGQAGAGKGRQIDGSVNDLEVDDAELTLKSAASMFGELVEEVGPPLKALSSKCTGAIHRLREAFEHRHKTTDAAMSPAIFLDLADKIERALFTFESTSNHALLRLYRRSDIVSGLSSRESGSIYSLNEYSENALTSGSDNENVFLVYFFIFTLQEFARELVSLVDAMGRIYAAERANAARGWWFQPFSAVFVRIMHMPTFQTFSLFPPAASYVSSDKRPAVASYFPKVRPHAPNTVQTPAREELSFIGRLKQTLWAIGDGMRDRKIKYAIKAGMATAILAAPAFFEVTRPIFVEYRGEWALISFFVVMSPTIGATNSLSIHRVLGTLFGAATAATVYSFFPENAVVLSIFGFFYSIPCFYYIVAMPQYATTGRFVLLTYNLTCLYCYNTRLKDVSVIDVAFHRSVAVTVGVAWAFVVSRFWWPSEARRELSKALGDFCLNIGWLYTRLVISNSFSPEPERHEETDTNVTEETSLIPKRRRTALDNSIEEFMAMEFHLQIKLIELQDLLKQTQHEPRLKGPFPIKLYRSILTSLQKILDNLHSMRCVTTREEWSNVRRDFIIPVNRERREMVGNIILYFSTLASAFRLKAPLPPYLPPAEKARQELVGAIRKLDVVKNRDVKGSRQLLFFAYALTMKGITKELDYLGSTLQDAFGVIGQGTDAFEALFRDDMRGAEQSV